MTGDGRTPQQDDDRSGAGRLAEEVSFSTIIASALAAITSFLLQSKIGLAGSLIGVGVAAAASALASQVYKWLLRTSATRIRDNLGVDEEAPACEPADVASVVAGDTVVRPRPGQTVGERRMAPASIRRAVARRRSKRRVKTALVFTAVVAVLAVLVYAAIVSLATSGRGIGSTETPLSLPGPSAPQTGTAPTASQTSDTPGADDARGTAASESGAGDARAPGTTSSVGGDAATTAPGNTTGDTTAGGDTTSGTANGEANGGPSDASSPTTTAPNGAADSTTGAGNGGAGAKGSKVGASS